MGRGHSLSRPGKTNPAASRRPPTRRSKTFREPSSAVMNPPPASPNHRKALDRLQGARLQLPRQAPCSEMSPRSWGVQRDRHRAVLLRLGPSTARPSGRGSSPRHTPDPVLAGTDPDHASKKSATTESAGPPRQAALATGNSYRPERSMAQQLVRSGTSGRTATPGGRRRDRRCPRRSAGRPSER